MKFFAKGSIVLNAIALTITMLYVQPQTGTAFSLANVDSHSTVNYSKSEETSATYSQAAEEIKDIVSSTENNSNENNNLESEGKSAARSYRATAYCLRGRTANGGGVRRGIVAADPRQLPLGTRIRLDGGSYSGTYTVTDTGGAIKGRILDVWVPSCSEAIRFGRRTVRVSVLGRNKKA